MMFDWYQHLSGTGGRQLFLVRRVFLLWHGDQYAARVQLFRELRCCHLRASERRAGGVDVDGVPLCLCALPAYFGGRANHNCDFAKNAPAMMDATVA